MENDPSASVSCHTKGFLHFSNYFFSFLFFINFLFSSLLRFGAPQSSPAKITRASQSSQPKIAAVLRRCLNQLDRKEAALSSLAFRAAPFLPRRSPS
jgi:hypothetical protein